MRSVCRVRFKKKRLQCTTKTVNLHVRLTLIVLEQVPRRWSSDREGATAVRIELKTVILILVLVLKDQIEVLVLASLVLVLILVGIGPCPCPCRSSP